MERNEAREGAWLGAKRDTAFTPRCSRIGLRGTWFRARGIMYDRRAGGGWEEDGRKKRECGVCGVVLSGTESFTHKP